MSDEEDRIIKFDDETAAQIKEMAQNEGKTFKEMAEEILVSAINNMRRKQRIEDMDEKLGRLRKEAEEAGITFPEYIRQLSKLGRELGAAGAIRDQHGIAKKDD